MSPVVVSASLKKRKINFQKRETEAFFPFLCNETCRDMHRIVYDLSATTPRFSDEFLRIILIFAFFMNTMAPISRL